MKFLDETGLRYFWKEIASFIDGVTSTSLVNSKKNRIEEFYTNLHKINRGRYVNNSSFSWPVGNRAGAKKSLPSLTTGGRTYDLLTFLCLSDTHASKYYKYSFDKPEEFHNSTFGLDAIQEAIDVAKYGLNKKGTSSKVVNTGKIAGIIHCGDMCSGSDGRSNKDNTLETRAAIVEMAQEIYKQVPFICVLGNHDSNSVNSAGSGITRAEDDETIYNPLFDTLISEGFDNQNLSKITKLYTGCYDFKYKVTVKRGTFYVHVITLNSNDIPMPGGNNSEKDSLHKQFISKEQINAIVTALTGLGSTDRVILVSHAPITSYTNSNTHGTEKFDISYVGDTSTFKDAYIASTPDYVLNPVDSTGVVYNVLYQLLYDFNNSAASTISVKTYNSEGTLQTSNIGWDFRNKTKKRFLFGLSGHLHAKNLLLMGIESDKTTEMYNINLSSSGGSLGSMDSNVPNVYGNNPYNFVSVSIDLQNKRLYLVDYNNNLKISNDASGLIAKGESNNINNKITMYDFGDLWS